MSKLNTKWYVVQEEGKPNLLIGTQVYQEGFELEFYPTKGLWGFSQWLEYLKGKKVVTEKGHNVDVTKFTARLIAEIGDWYGYVG